MSVFVLLAHQMARLVVLFLSLLLAAVPASSASSGLQVTDRNFREAVVDTEEVTVLEFFSPRQVIFAL